VELPNGEITISLKKDVRNRARLETCMAFGYMYEEALGFCT
jgi:hypothetical protein